VNFLYGLLLVVVLGVLLQRTLQDKNQYAVFKKLKHTADRQKTYKRWVAESFFVLWWRWTGDVAFGPSIHTDYFGRC
jgi:hypothetical protein